MRIQLCGSFALRLDGERAEERLPGRQGRMLFAYLTLHRDRPVARDQLVEAMWPRDPPSAPSLALNPLVSKLRRVVGPDRLPGKDNLRLVLPDDAWIDVQAAVEGVHRAESAVDAADWVAAYGPSQLALHISERLFLEGLDAPWIEEERRRLAEVMVRALECSVECFRGLGGTELRGAERCARRLVTAAPFRERGYRLLMEVLAQRGETAEALRVYEELRVLLREELGAAPSPASQAVHARLLGVEPALGSRRANRWL